VTEEKLQAISKVINNEDIKVWKYEKYYHNAKIWKTSKLEKILKNIKNIKQMKKHQKFQKHKKIKKFIYTW